MSPTHLAPRREVAPANFPVNLRAFVKLMHDLTTSFGRFTGLGCGAAPAASMSLGNRDLSVVLFACVNLRKLNAMDCELAH